MSTTKPEVFRFRLHPAIWATASTHFVADAYGHMYAPLLPLALLAISGLYMFFLPYFPKKRAGA